jgi:hypothetical protein
MYGNLLNITVTNRAVFCIHLHIFCKQIKTENKICVLHSLTLFLSSACQSLIPPRMLLGKMQNFFLCCNFWLCKKKWGGGGETWPPTLTRVTPSLKPWHCVRVNELWHLRTFITNLQTRLQILSLSKFRYLLVGSKSSAYKLHITSAIFF